MNSEYKILNNNTNLIICFGGMGLKFGKIPPFEFLRYLSSNFKDNCDLIFYIDKNKCWYHKGIHGITNNIADTIIYLNKIIKNYKKVLFMGTSAGGYASLLFGSLCDNVYNIISFMPQTILTNPINLKYANLKNIIDKNKKYILCGDVSIRDKNDNHHILHVENLESFSNIEIIKFNNLIMKQLRDDGIIKKLINNILFED